MYLQTDSSRLLSQAPLRAPWHAAHSNRCPTRCSCYTAAQISSSHALQQRQIAHCNGFLSYKFLEQYCHPGDSKQQQQATGCCHPLARRPPNSLQILCKRRAHMSALWHSRTSYMPHANALRFPARPGTLAYVQSSYAWGGRHRSDCLGYECAPLLIFRGRLRSS